VSRQGVVALAFGIGLAVGAGALIAARPAPGKRAVASDLSASRRTAIVTAAERVSPAVVSVNVIQTRVVRTDPFGGALRDEFFDRFYPPMTRREQVPGIGSGVIVAGRHVLTNEHVVRDAERITVTLTDGREFPAKVLGSTSTYDLAVLQIDGDRLPAAPLGDSDDLVVGEWAIAIGNPFGFLLNDPQPTVTAGVISATNRDIKSEATESGMYKNMLQTDAAINPGNSGGPLVNGDGEVIGLNTFIFTRGGGSLGIGFAIPINLARRILDEIVTYGRLRTAWPGMQVQPVNAVLAQRLGYKEAGGLVITRVEEGGPAEKAGLRREDRIREVQGRKVDTIDDIQRSIYGAAVGDRLEIAFERAGKLMEVTLTLVEAPPRRTP